MTKKKVCVGCKKEMNKRDITFSEIELSWSAIPNKLNPINNKVTYHIESLFCKCCLEKVFSEFKRLFRKGKEDGAK